MGEMNSKTEAREYYMKLQNIKTFLEVKKRNSLLNPINKLENLMKELQGKFVLMNSKLDELEKQNQLLIDVNEEINKNIIRRIKTVAKETKEIKTSR